jgi:hypothetical protein
MTAFAIGTPVITREVTITVDAGLPIGRHRFRLEVIDAADRRSAADEEIVEVQGRVIGPTGPVIDPAGPVIDPTGPVIGPAGPVIGPVGPVVGPVGPIREPPVINREGPARRSGQPPAARRPRSRKRKDE